MSEYSADHGRSASSHREKAMREIIVFQGSTIMEMQKTIDLLTSENRAVNREFFIVLKYLKLAQEKYANVAVVK